MKPKNLISGIALLACPVAGLSGAASDADPARDADQPRAKVPLEVDSGAYVSKHDIVYLSPPTEGYEGLPIGNGDVGGMIWTSPTGILMQINKSDAFGDPNAETRMVLRSCGRLTLDFAAPCFEWLYLKDFEGRLSLPGATASFRTETPFLKVSVEVWVRVDGNVLALQCRSEGLGDLQDGAVARVGLTRWGSRAFPGWYGGISRDPAMGLGNAAAQVRGKDILIRETSEGLDFAMACRVLGGPSSPQQVSRRRAEIEVQAAPRQDFTILLAAATAEESDDPVEAAIALLDDSERRGIEALRKEHQRWWGDFWKRSFVSLGDDYIENLYYFKRYLMASSSRGRYPALFNGGIWTWNHDVRNWVTPHHWNMQQAYWSVCASNDCDLLLPYVNAYWRLVPQAREHAKMRGADDSLLWSEGHDFAGRMCFWDRGDMLNNFTPASQIAGFFWQYYLYTGDEAFLREKAYPFLKGAAEFYLQTLQWDEEKGEYFIFPSQPYESPQGNQFRNPITDHGMIQATFRACLEASKILGADAGKRAEWEKVLRHLWTPPKMNLPGVGEVFGAAYFQDGAIHPKIDDAKSEAEIAGRVCGHFGAGTSFVFPAGIVGLDDRGSADFEAAARLARMHPPGHCAITPGAIVSARLGMADKARELLEHTIRRLQHFPQGLFYNIDHWYLLSRYHDSVEGADVITQRDYVYDRLCRYEKQGGFPEGEGTPALPFVQCGLEPLGILATAVNEMLLQSHEGKIRVFPATPDDWPAAFTLRAVGGFLVSSEKGKKGPARYVLIESLLGRPCRIANPWPGRKVSARQLRPEQAAQTLEGLPDGVLSFSTAAGGLYVLRPEDESSSPLAVSRFTASPNSAPKRFKEAILGKVRDF